jgi:ATP-dependent helicase YprA (DUF1998 family)
MDKKIIKLKESELISIIRKSINESKVSRPGLLIEGPKENASAIYNKCQNEKRKATLKRGDIESIAADIFDAIDGVGTKENKIKNSILRCQSMVNFCEVSKVYKTFYDEDLFDAIDGDVDYDSDWRDYVYLPLYTIDKNQQEFDATEAAAAAEQKKKQDEINKQNQAAAPTDQTIPAMACWKKEKQSSGYPNEGMHLHADKDFVYWFDGKGAAYGFYINASPGSAYYYKNKAEYEAGTSTKKGKAYCDGDEITFFGWN